jgi:hypothetical protein
MVCFFQHDKLTAPAEAEAEAVAFQVPGAYASSCRRQSRPEDHMSLEFCTVSSIASVIKVELECFSSTLGLLSFTPSCRVAGSNGAVKMKMVKVKSSSGLSKRRQTFRP